ncbi:Bifunctional glutamine synthetase adenylyltransferase/adenylyl-removing enzyme [compost metagenome]
MPALEAAASLGFLEPDEAELLLKAWRLASRIRSANVIWTGRASDLLPSSRRDLEAVARWCGYQPGNAAALEEDYLRISRQARAVFDRVFYGQ